MNQIFKRFLAASLTGVFCLSVVPLSAGAVGAKADATPKTSPFCSNLSAKSGDITAKLSAAQAKASQAWTQQDQKLAARATAVDQKVATVRQQADAQRATNFTKLEAKAKTDAQKSAVTTYEASVKSAVATRREAYDAARAAFRTGVNSAVASRHSTVGGQFSTLNDSVNSAIAAAQTACANDPSGGQAARSALQASLKTARQSFQTDRKGDDKVRAQIDQLVVTRQAAFKQADATFKASMDTARQALKQAFGSSAAV